MIRMSLLRLALVIASSTTFLLAAQVPSQADKKGELGGGSDDDWSKLLNTKVETATKGEKQTIAEAPAIISIVTKEEIRDMGYRSVAQAMESVPGFYTIDDRVAPNLGVRGINGGLRAYSRIIKVMIDGQPVSFRPDGANFLGPELIPMDMVEHIEIIRGPASSLYGADAFLGVINVITRKPDQDRQSNGFLVRAGIGSKGNLQGLGGRFGVLHDRWDLTVAASGEVEDRSGYALPPTSPVLLSNPALESLASSNDKSRPFNALVSANLLPKEDLTIGFLGYFSRLDASGEFLDYGLLSPNNRISLSNAFGRVKTEWTPSPVFSLSASLAMASGKPTGNEYLDSGGATSHARRDIGFDSVDSTLEVRWAIRTRDKLTFGVDHSSDQEQLMTVYSVDNATGTSTPILEKQGKKTFGNSGVYAQYAAYPIEGLGITANLRHDRHNIYGNKSTYRIGLVYAITADLHVKGLYGTSFKAPTAWQLYAQPLFGGEVVGNPELKPESAKTLEVEVGWTPSDKATLSLNAFWNKVEDKVELVQRSGNQFPVNTGLLSSHGIEAQARIGIGKHQFTGSLAWQKSEAHLPVAFTQGAIEPSSMYPSLTGYLRWRLLVTQDQSTGLDWKYASGRRATDSNITENFLRPYALGGYTLVDAFWTCAWKEPRSTWRVQLRVNNLLDKRIIEPGFAGVDLPGYGRQVVLTFGCQF